MLPVAMALGMSAAVAPAATAATSTCTPDKSTIAQCFPDTRLASLVAQAAGHDVGQPLTKHDIASITKLDSGFGSISNLQGIENLTNLTDLWLYDNQISDISPLAKLTNLTDLELSWNQISDISPLAKLTNLTDLNLEGNQVSDASPLAKLTNLTDLWLDDNQVSDASPLAKLTKLTYLQLDDNQISDVSPLAKLTKLGTNDGYLGLGLQSVPLPAVASSSLSVPTARNVDGSFIRPDKLTPSSGSYDAKTGKASWKGLSGSGNAVLHASTTVTVGKGAYQFDVTITQPYTPPKPKPVPTLAISFDANGGKFANGSTTQKVSVKQGAKYALPAAPARSGYTFSGWFTAKTGGSRVTGSPVAGVSRTLYAQWVKDAVAPRASAKGSPVAVYRVYNRYSGLHHYTTSARERDALVVLGWNNEGASFNAAKQGSAKGLKPVYREYNPHNGNHNWTLNPSEHKQLVELGWKDEGVAWYANPSGPVTVYRLYNPHSGEHVYTTSAKEYAAVGAAGWHQEGTAWKGL
jgi:uncharacterized repeat protein (TIGR02543 family)